MVSSTDLRQLALNALNPIEKKLQGMEAEKQISVSNQVDKLIQEATSLQKLVTLSSTAGCYRLTLAIGKDVCRLDSLGGR